MSTKKKVITLVISMLVIACITYIAGSLKEISNFRLRVGLNILFNLLNALVAIIAMKITDIKLDLDFKNKKSYIIGICIGLILILFFGIIPLLFGGNIIGPHSNFSFGLLLFNFIYFMFVIGPVEEIVFRVYIQETFMVFFNKKWIGIIITSIIFGFWHIINGSLAQVIFATSIGLVFGFSKYLIKNCKYLGVAIGHGLYDFLTIVIRMFVI